MKKRNKGKYIVILAAFLSIAFAIFLSPSFMPTANAIKVSGDFQKVNDDPFSNLEGDLDNSNFIPEKSSGNSEKNSGGEEETEQDFTPDDSVEKNDDENVETETNPEVKSNSNINLNGYKSSLEKIKSNYFEIESEIEKLERIKGEIEESNMQNLETQEQIKLIQKEIELLKMEEGKDKKSFSFYGFLTTLNLLALTVIFLYSKNYKMRRYK